MRSHNSVLGLKGKPNLQFRRISIFCLRDYVLMKRTLCAFSKISFIHYLICFYIKFKTKRENLRTIETF